MIMGNKWGRSKEGPSSESKGVIICKEGNSMMDSHNMAPMTLLRASQLLTGCFCFFSVIVRLVPIRFLEFQISVSILPNLDLFDQHSPLSPLCSFHPQLVCPLPLVLVPLWLLSPFFQIYCKQFYVGNPDRQFPSQELQPNHLDFNNPHYPNEVSSSLLQFISSYSQLPQCHPQCGLESP